METQSDTCEHSVREKEMVREYFFYTNLDLYLRRDLEHNVTSLLPNPLFQKDKDGRVVATAATVSQPFCSQSFQKWGVPCSGMNNLAGCTTMNC